MRKKIGLSLLIATVLLCTSSVNNHAFAVTIPDSLPLFANPTQSHTVFKTAFSGTTGTAVKQPPHIFLTKFHQPKIPAPTPTPQLVAFGPPVMIDPAPTEEPIEEPLPTIMTTATPAVISPTPTAQSTPKATPPTGSQNPELLFDMSNAHRKNLGLPAFQKDDRVCSLARERAPEIHGEMAKGTLHSGMYGRNLPYWNTENAVAYGSEQESFNWLISDYIHRKAIEGNYTYSCVACSGNACVQEFTSFQPK